MRHWFYNYMTKKYDFTIPFKRLWFMPPYWIRKYNMKDCEFYYPDWQDGNGTKVKAFFGHVLIKPKGEEMSYDWWKYLRKV